MAFSFEYPMKFRCLLICGVKVKISMESLRPLTFEDPVAWNQNTSGDSCSDFLSPIPFKWPLVIFLRLKVV